MLPNLMSRDKFWSFRIRRREREFGITELGGTG